MKLSRLIFCLLLVFQLGDTGCRTFTPPARAKNLDNGVVWIDYDATRRGAFLVPPSSGMMIVSEPAPDVAMGVVADFVAKGSYAGADGNLSAKVTESIVELGKRTQTVMVLRELLFRINEMQLLNKDMTKDDIKGLYNDVMDTILAMALADKNASDTAKLTEIRALTQTLGDEKTKKLLENLGIADPATPAK